MGGFWYPTRGKGATLGLDLQMDTDHPLDELETTEQYFASSTNRILRLPITRRRHPVVQSDVR